MTPRILAYVLTASVAMGSCGGREAHPVQAATSIDVNTSCGALTAEFTANLAQIQSKAAERSSNNAKNAVAGAAGLFFPPSLFLMDLKSYEKAEIDALEARNKVLSAHMRTRCSKR